MKFLYLVGISAFFALVPVSYAAVININAADAKTLDKELKGVSPKTAQAIVDYRGKNGPFKTVDDLTKVKGVGKATVDKNRTNLNVGQQTTK